MRGIGERCNNVWPQSASRDLPPKKLRGMQGMQHKEEKKRGRRREDEERRGEEGANPPLSSPLQRLNIHRAQSCNLNSFLFFFGHSFPSAELPGKQAGSRL